MITNNIFEILNNQVFFASAVLLILGFLFSRAANKARLPRVTGYIIAGIIIGPSLLSVLKEHSLNQLDFMSQFALGIIALIIGAGLSLNLIKRLGFRLLTITLFESIGAFILVSVLLKLFGMPLPAVLPLAAIAAATAPAATVAVIREYRSSGPFTETTLAVVALDDAIAITLFGLIMTLDVRHFASIGGAAVSSIYSSFIEIVACFFVGCVLALIAHILIKLTREVSDVIIVVLGIVFLSITIASVVEISPLLTNMFLGMIIINISAQNNEIIGNLEKMTPPLYCFFFVLAGAHLDFKVFASVGAVLVMWGVVFVLARLAGKISGSYIGGALSRSPDNIRRYLGLALAPQAGVAIGLSLLISRASGYFEFRSVILNITLMAVAINEIVGPLLTKYALFKAGEAESAE